ncbi:MAG: 50S ribosomal protein L3 [Chlamydiae bacterium]|nr:50S ribosomal protein L3 [Chlamydiota bacterium]MBI3266281.1 50S ribosomal protein L3 [Chlamydiota bacterium]
MVHGILGKKVGMTRIFNPQGLEIPISVIEAGPCPITQIKTLGKDSYNAIQMGYEPIQEKRTKKPLLNHFKKAGLKPMRWLREWRVCDEKLLSDLKVGQEIRVDIFKPGDHVDVIGWTKGRGFQGVVKRHGFRGLRATHGNKEYFRRPGSIGTNTFGSNTKRGKKFPGHYGNERQTLLNLEVIRVDVEENVLVLRGGIPGAKGGFLMVRKSERG